jgi:hypothetical protein
MSDVRKFRPRPQFYCVFLVLLGLSVFASTQDKDKDKGEKASKKGAAAGFVKVEGKVRCEKADPMHALEVPDRPGHALTIEKRKCTWTEPIEIMGSKTKEGVSVGFAEKMEGALHTHVFEVDELDTGEKLTLHSNGQILGEKGPATAKGRWNFMRGTGKFKGIKGVGSYEGKLGADDVLTLEFEGVYDPSEMVAGKK